MNLSFTIERKTLAELIKRTMVALPSSTAAVTLTNFHVRAENGILTLTTTDGDKAAQASTEDVLIVKDGVTLIPETKLREIMSNGNGDDISIKETGKSITLTSGTAKWVLRTQSSEIYPKFPDMSEMALYAVNRAALSSQIDRVKFACASDRFNLAQIDITNGVLTASDGVRFQQARIDDHLPINVKLPREAADDVVKFLNSGTYDHIQVGHTATHVVLYEAETGTTMLFRQTGENFPDLTEVIETSKNAEFVLKADLADLIRTIKRVRITSDPDSAAVILRLVKGKIYLSAKDRNGNSSEDYVAAEWDYPERTVVVNHKYFGDTLAAMKLSGEDAEIRLGEDKSQHRRSPVAVVSSNLTGIVQQMRPDFRTELS